MDVHARSIHAASSDVMSGGLSCRGRGRLGRWGIGWVGCRARSARATRPCSDGAMSCHCAGSIWPPGPRWTNASRCAGLVAKFELRDLDGELLRVVAGPRPPPLHRAVAVVSDSPDNCCSNSSATPPRSTNTLRALHRLLVRMTRFRPASRGARACPKSGWSGSSRSSARTNSGRCRRRSVDPVLGRG